MTFVCLLMVFVSSIIVAKLYASEANYVESFKQTGGQVFILQGGKLLKLNLDQKSRSSIESTSMLLYGKIDMQIKLASGDSAGILTAFYLSSEGNQPYDEIGFNFFRSSSGQPYTVQTNVVTEGKNDRIQQFSLWFDPTKDFHTYSILWNTKNIIFRVDTTPIRVFKNMESSGVPYPNKRQMRIHASIRKGVVGTVEPEWSRTPFSVYFQDFTISTGGNQPWLQEELEPSAVLELQNKFMTYNYCTDRKRFSQGLPPECK